MEQDVREHVNTVTTIDSQTRAAWFPQTGGTLDLCLGVKDGVMIRGVRHGAIIILE